MNKTSFFITFSAQLPVLRFNRDVSKHIKRGHQWFFEDCFYQDECKKASSGFALFRHHHSENILGIGIFLKGSTLSCRFLFESRTRGNRHIQIELEEEFNQRWKLALKLRHSFYIETSQTTGFRLINGEGDLFPGLVIDLYGKYAVIKLDRSSLEKIWNLAYLAERLKEDFPNLEGIYYKNKIGEESQGKVLWGDIPEVITFKENGMIFSTQLREAAKTGFFLDQRDNRHVVRQLAKEKNVLNLFSYTGGFSVAAGLGFAASVTSVDIAKMAIENCEDQFQLNHLETKRFHLAQDVFVFLEEAIKKNKYYDFIIIDPPSFAPNEKSIDSAIAAYKKIFLLSMKLLPENGGFMAFSSCSSHITEAMFFGIIEECIAENKKKSQLIYRGGQPIDHPFMISMWAECKYLKFYLLSLLN